MRVREFLSVLPTLFEDWGTAGMRAKDGDWQQVVDQVAQQHRPNFYALVDAACGFLEPGEVLCEIGCLAGGNLVAGLWNNPEVLAYGIDLYSPEEDEAEQKVELLEENLAHFDVLNRVCFAHVGVDEFFGDLRDTGSADRFGVYVYSFVPDYRQLLMSLLLARPWLTDQAVLVIGNGQLPQVQQAVNDFLAAEPAARVLLDWQIDDPEVFGGKGVAILVWDRQNQLMGIEPMVICPGVTEIAVDPVAAILARTNRKKVLHVGCGPYNPNALPPELRTEDWQEIRLDIDPKMQPDILGTITDLGAVPDACVDAVYSSHNLEHIYDYEVPLALAEFKRVLKPGGLTWLVVPDMQLAAEWVVKGDMDDQPLYISPAGPVRALWMFYGMGTSIPGMPFMAHKTGFTASGLQGRLTVAGFSPVEVSRGNFNVYAKGYKEKTA